jgi:hypothetical protein
LARRQSGNSEIFSVYYVESKVLEQEIDCSNNLEWASSQSNLESEFGQGFGQSNLKRDFGHSTCILNSLRVAKPRKESTLISEGNRLSLAHSILNVFVALNARCANGRNSTAIRSHLHCTCSRSLSVESTAHVHLHLHYNFVDL